MYARPVLGVLTAPLLLAGVVVLGEGREGCPRAPEVSARMHELMPDDPGPPDGLIFDGAAGALRVRLLSPEGQLREEKTLELRGSCDELADAVATLAVTWRSRLQSQNVAPPVLLVPPLAQEFEAPEAAPVRAPSLFELSLGLQTVSGIKRWAPGFLLGVQMPLHGAFNLGLTLDFSAPRVAFANDLRWSWMQVALVAAPSYRMAIRDLYMDTMLGLGTGFNITLNSAEQLPGRRSRLVPPTVVGGARWTYWRASASPWFGINLSVQLDPQLASPVEGTNVPPERWVMGVALGGTLGLDGDR